MKKLAVLFVGVTIMATDAFGPGYTFINDNEVYAEQVVYIVPDSEPVPVDPDCAPCGVMRREEPWPYQASGPNTLLPDDLEFEGKLVPTWAPNTRYAQYSIVKASDTTKYPYFYRAEWGGTTGSVEPDWPLSNLARVEDDPFPLGVTWGNWAPMPFDYEATVRIVTVENTPAPKITQQFTAYMDGNAWYCPTYTRMVQTSNYRRPYLLDGTNSPFATFIVRFEHDLVISDEIAFNPDRFDFYFNGVKNNYKDVSYHQAGGWDLTLYSYYSSIDPGYSDPTDPGETAVGEMFIFEEQFDKPYFYITMLADDFSSPHVYTLEVKEAGVSIASMTLTATKVDPNDNEGKVLVVMSNITGTLFGSADDNVDGFYDEFPTREVFSCEAP